MKSKTIKSDSQLVLATAWHGMDRITVAEALEKWPNECSTPTAITVDYLNPQYSCAARLPASWGEDKRKAFLKRLQWALQCNLTVGANTRGKVELTVSGVTRSSANARKLVGAIQRRELEF